MASFGTTRTIANLAIISALTVTLGACGGGMSLPSFGSSSSAPAQEPGVAPEMPATIRGDELVGKWGLASYQNPADRARTEKQAQAQCKQPYVIGAGGSGGVIMHLADQAHAAGIAHQGQPKRQELYRPARPAARRAGPRDRLLRRPRADHPLRRQGRGDPLRQHGLCPLRAAGLRVNIRHCEEPATKLRSNFAGATTRYARCASYPVESPKRLRVGVASRLFPWKIWIASLRSQ